MVLPLRGLVAFSGINIRHAFTISDKLFEDVPTLKQETTRGQLLLWEMSLLWKVVTHYQEIISI